MPFSFLLCVFLLSQLAVARNIDRSEAFVGYAEKERPQAGNSSCRDLDRACRGWADSGECESNAAFMVAKCALSCGACPSTSGAASALPAPPPGAPPPQRVTFTTSLGAITVQLRPDIAPRVAAYVAQLAAARGEGCSACRFYRAEARPAPGAVDNYGGPGAPAGGLPAVRCLTRRPGPPYALIQGSLASSSFAPIEKEGTPPFAQRGDACFIGAGPDFFIAVGGHPEWGAGHTVWGRVVGAAGMAVVDAIAEEQPVKAETWGQTHVTVLVEPLPFSLALEEAVAGR